MMNPTTQGIWRYIQVSLQHSMSFHNIHHVLKATKIQRRKPTKE